MVSQEVFTYDVPSAWVLQVEVEVGVLVKVQSVSKWLEVRCWSLSEALQPKESTTCHVESEIWNYMDLNSLVPQANINSKAR